jgi:hypothetical protein
LRQHQNLNVMKRNKTLIPTEKIDRAILYIRGVKVMIDSDLAELYGVSTSRLNEQVKRNSDRFPEDFMFQLTLEEKQEVIANCDHLKKLKYSPYLPFAFTEHGSVMLASVVNSKVAIIANIQIVRTFVKLREMLDSNKQLSVKLEELEKKYDKQFLIVFEAIRQLMSPENTEREPIGYKIKTSKK